jgi:hypothetical protein
MTASAMISEATARTGLLPHLFVCGSLMATLCSYRPWGCCSVWRLAVGGYQLITDSGLLTDELTDDLTDELCGCAWCSFALRAQEDRTRRHKPLTRSPPRVAELLMCDESDPVRRIRSSFHQICAGEPLSSKEQHPLGPPKECSSGR